MCTDVTLNTLFPTIVTTWHLSEKNFAYIISESVEENTLSTSRISTTCTEPAKHFRKPIKRVKVVVVVQWKLFSGDTISLCTIGHWDTKRVLILLHHLQIAELQHLHESRTVATTRLGSISVFCFWMKLPEMTHDKRWSDSVNAWKWCFSAMLSISLKGNSTNIYTWKCVCRSWGVLLRVWMEKKKVD